MTSHNGIEILVLEGDQAGARSNIALGEKLKLSSGLEGDILLRDDGNSDTTLNITILADYADVEVISGKIGVMGKEYCSGDIVKLPQYRAATLGKTKFAFGEAKNDQWSEVYRIDDELDNIEIEDNENIDSEDSNVFLNSENNENIKPKNKKIKLYVIVLFVIVAGCVLFFYNGRLNRVETVNSKGILLETLTSLDSENIKIQENPDNVFIIYGYIDTYEKYSEIRKGINSLELDVRLNFDIGEDIKHQVENIYRLHGINAKINFQEKGVVSVETKEHNIKKLDEVRMIAIKDVDRLKEVVVINHPERKIESYSNKNINPEKRITMVVRGDPAYIVTFDGSRYFVGAVLPTGHTVKGITDTQVMLSKGGEITKLNF